MSSREWRINTEYRFSSGKWATLTVALPSRETCRSWVKGARDVNRNRQALPIESEYRNIKIETRQPGGTWKLEGWWSE
jgi:hypothetical protein